VQEQLAAFGEVAGTGDHPIALVGGGGRLSGGETVSIPRGDVGEGTADIDPYPVGYHRLMAISIEGTPNPNALKFSVGQDVGGPKTYIAGRPVDDPMAQMLLMLPGVTSVFMTADFVTLTKAPDADWMLIAEQAQKILEGYFDAT
jgi:hypothetical protein